MIGVFGQLIIVVTTYSLTDSVKTHRVKLTVLTDGRSHSKNVEMDPRKNGRKSSTTQHTLDSGNASPQSAVMEIDTSVTRSENQTPITSMFVSGGPGSFSHQSREPAKDGGPDNLKQLMETLLQFTKSVTTMATVTVQRDTARAKAEKQVTEYQRWRRHHESFTSLAEEHDKEMAKAKQHTERMDERLKRHEHARDSAIRMMAATMLAVSSGSAIPKFGEDDQKKQLEWELKDVKAELDGIKNTLANTVRSINDKAPIQVEAELKNVKADLRDNAIALSNLQETVIQSKESVQTKQARLSAQVNELEKKVIHGKSHTDLNAQIQDSLGHFSNEMAHLKERADSYDNLKLELSKTQARVNDLSNDVSKEQEGLLALKNEMTGDGQDDPGLFDLIAKQEANIENFGQTLKRFNEELNGFNEDVQQHGSRITSLESISSTTSAKASLAGSNPEIKDMIATVAQDLTELREDQEKKDEMVAEDAEKLSKSLNALETEVELLRQQYTEVINSQHTRSLEAQSQDNQSGMPDKHLTSQQQNNEVLSGSSNLPQEHVNLAVNQDENSVVKLQAVLAIHRAAIEDYRERLITCEAFTFSLQQRYDNLTTEHLARSMVNQMQTMYPYAANTQTEIESAKDRLSVMTHEISQLSTILATITKRLNNTELESIQSQGSDIMVLKDRLVRLSDDLTGNLRTLTDQVDSLKEDSKVNTEKLHALNETLNESVKLGKRELGEIESTKEDIDQLQRRFENYEETTVTELASLHGQVALLNDQAGIASFESEAPADLSESGESDDLPSATVLIANASANSKRKNTAVMDGVRMEQAQSPESPVVKTLLLKRKDQSKRRRGGSDDSGSPGTRKKPAL